MQYTKEVIAKRIATNNQWLIRGLLAIHARQTDDEKNSETTKEENGVGFNAFDATILTDLVNQYKRTGYLSRRQLDLIRGKMKKYAKQLTRIANGDL